ncbi:VENN motif pre-toxin domain-containing protein [Orbus wheelerorum]|uniref:VENN motif pre-toxin domain-containing protein n=1 Tax=Orbus wheelerorum TaxID=3074111 RepID=UPI00370D96AF
MQKNGIGSMGDGFSKGLDAASAIVIGIISGDITGGLAGASAPYLAEQIKKQTGHYDEAAKDWKTEDKAANLIAHALLGAGVAAAQGNSALAGGIGAVSGEAAADYIRKTLYNDRDPSNLTQAEKENISALAQLASGLAVAAGSGGNIGDVGTAVAGSKNAVENNRLATVEEQKPIDGLAKDNEQEKLLYQAAACTLINCSAELADDDPMKKLYQTLEELGSTDELKSYREALALQEYIKTNFVPDVTGFYPITYETVEKLFEYTSVDKFVDSAAYINNEYSVTTRVGGALQVGFAAGEGALAMTLSPACTSVVGCAPSALLTWSAIDNATTGVTVIIDGKSYATQTGKGLAKLLNISESNGDLLFNAATGLASAKGLANLASSSLSSGNKLTTKESETIKSEVDRVGKLTVDPHAGKVKLAEGSAATDLEKLLGGKVERIKDKDNLADFVFTSGPNKGKTVDFMFTTANGTEKEINAMNQFFNNNWDNNIEVLHTHLDKADIVPLDFRKLTLENQQRLESYINTLSKSQ